MAKRSQKSTQNEGLLPVTETKVRTATEPFQQLPINATAKEAESPGLMFTIAKSGAIIENVTRSLATDPTAYGHLTLQPQLQLGQIGDRYEQEADAVAAETVQILHRQPLNPTHNSIDEDTVQRNPQTPTFQQVHPLIQPTGLAGGGDVAPHIEQHIHREQGSGKSLPNQHHFEQAMGADFSAVTVHDNTKSDQINTQLASRAFTTGTDIFFKQGELNPGTPKGDELLAHELTHVKQQNPQLNLKPVEQVASPQVSRATKGVIQRDLITDFAPVKKAAEERRLLVFTKESKTMDLVEKLLIGFESNRTDPERYVYLEKALHLLIHKQDKFAGMGLGNAIEAFRKTFDVTLAQERKLYDYWMESSLKGGEEETEEPTRKRSHHEKIKQLIAEHSSDLPESSGKLSTEYNEFVSGQTKKSRIGKGFTIQTLDEKQLKGIALDFRKATIKHGKILKYERGEILSEVDNLLLAHENHYAQAEEHRDKNEDEQQQAELERAIAYLQMALDMIELWLLKYEAKVKVNDQNEVVKDESPGGIYAIVRSFRDQFAQQLGDESTWAGIDIAHVGLGAIGKNATDEDVLAKFRYEHVLKKYGNRYKGDCGVFFGNVYPTLINTLVPNVGDKGKFEMDCLFPIWPPAGLGFHIKIDAERKDEHELKNFVDLIFQGGADGGVGRIVGGIGMYFEMVANTAKKIGQLFSYSLYRRFRESSVIPEEVISFLWGSGDSHAAEAWAMGVEEGIFGKMGDKAVEKAYAESGFAARLAGWAEADLGPIGEAGGRFDALGGAGMRYSQDSFLSTGAFLPLNAKNEIVTYPDYEPYRQQGIVGKQVQDVKFKYDPKKDEEANYPNGTFTKEIKAEQEAQYTVKRYVSDIDEKKTYKLINPFTKTSMKVGIDPNRERRTTGRGAWKTRGQSSGRFEVELKAKLGKFVEASVKPKLEWLGSGLHPLQNLNKMEVEVKFKAKTDKMTTSVLGASLIQGATGILTIAKTLTSGLKSATNQKAKEQETEDDGLAENTIGGMLQGVSSSILGAGSALQAAGANLTTSGGTEFVFDAGAQARMKLGLESNSLAQQIIEKQKWLGKSKGEFHIELFQGLKLKFGSSEVGAEFASRIFSTKWEGAKAHSAILGALSLGMAPGGEQYERKRLEGGFGAFDLDIKKDPKDPKKKKDSYSDSPWKKPTQKKNDPAQIQKKYVELWLAKAGTRMFVQAHRANLVSLTPEKQLENWQKLTKLVADNAVQDLAKMPLDGLPGTDWPAVFAKAMKTYADVPEKFLKEDNSEQLDGIFLGNLLQTAMGKENMSAAVQKDIFNHTGTAPNLAKYYAGEDYDQNVAIQEANQKVAAAKTLAEAVQANYTPPILPPTDMPPPPPPIKSSESDNDGTSGKKKRTKKSRRQRGYAMSLPQPKTIQEEDTTEQIPPPPKLTLEAVVMLTTQQIAEMENRFSEAVALSVSGLPTVANGGFPGELCLGKLAHFGDIIRGAILTIPDGMLASSSSVKNYLSSNQVFDKSVLRSDTLLSNFCDALTNQASESVLESLQNETTLRNILHLLDVLENEVSLFDHAVLDDTLVELSRPLTTTLPQPQEKSKPLSGSHRKTSTKKSSKK